MSSFSSPALYIDFSRLPPPKVVEEIAYETLLTAYKAGVLKKNPDLEKALELEQSSANIILEVEAYGEMLVRARVNAAARSLMLAFASGSNLDAIASKFQLGFPHEIARLPLVDQPRNVDKFPEDWESDVRFRRRIQLVPEAYSTAGSEGSYIFHALSCDPTIADISVNRINDRAGIKIAVMSEGADPAPSREQLGRVTKRLFSTNCKAFTDVLSIAPAKIFDADLTARIQIYPGPDAGLVLADVEAGLKKLRSRVSRLGFDLTRAAVNAALMVEGVQNVRLSAPTQDVIVNKDGCIRFGRVDVRVESERVE